ncbi:MAG: GlmU family protein [Crocinitomicaceae bacterium]|nr:GlmU family protein [Crocinitomicaceae bacterium]
MDTKKTQVILFEDSLWSSFLPLVYTRPVGALRMGILTMAERWELAFRAEVGHFSRPGLEGIFPSPEATEGFLINARLFPDEQLINKIAQLRPGEALKKGSDLLVVCFRENKGEVRMGSAKTQFEYENECLTISTLTDLFTKNDEVMKRDFTLCSVGRKSIPAGEGCRVIGPPELLFISEGASTICATFNTTDGPIYIGCGAEVMEGSMIRGPFALCDYAQVKMGTKIYGATTIGPYSKVGGEISNSVITGYSNKGHDGFIGNSILGEWCNLGADTNTSNLKNNYSTVRAWNYSENKEVNTGLTFCGLIMGDHSRCSINTMFNTGTVVGVSANIFGSGFPPKHVPSFTWGGAEATGEYDLLKAIETAGRVMSRRHTILTAPYRKLLTDVFNITAQHRISATQSQK